jgi:acyl-CoA synthetase (AMP-forming)/AMP-acid ligase II
MNKRVIEADLGLSSIAKKHPHRLAIADSSSHRLYYELSQEVREIESTLVSLDFLPGDRVAILLENPIEQIAGFFGVLSAGGCAVMLNDSGLGSSLHLVHRLGCNIALISQPHQAVGFNELKWIGDNIGIASRVQDPRKSSARKVEGKECDNHSDFSKIPAVVILTTGTSGEPKLIQHTRAGLREGYELVHSGMSEFSGAAIAGIVKRPRVMSKWRGILRAVQRRKVWMSTLPVHRIAGLSLLLQAILGGETFIVGQGQAGMEVDRLLRRRHVTILATSPMGAELLLRGRRTGSQHRDLLAIGIGSDKPFPDLIGRLSECFRCHVIVGYGSTELGGGITATRLGTACSVEGAVGRPLRGVRARVVDQQGAILPYGEVGTLACCIPPAMRGEQIGLQTPGLKGAPDREEKNGRSSGSEGSECELVSEWAITEDLAWMNENEEIFIVGRSDDVIVRGGVNVDPARIELTLEQHESIARAGVVAFRRLSGQTGISAFCQVADPGSDCVSANELRVYCKQRLPSSCVPDRVEFVRHVPVSVEGKVRRALLREWCDRRLDLHEGCDDNYRA